MVESGESDPCKIYKEDLSFFYKILSDEYIRN